jgi:hypothetical protein
MWYRKGGCVYDHNPSRAHHCSPNLKGYLPTGKPVISVAMVTCNLERLLEEAI